MVAATLGGDADSLFSGTRGPAAVAERRAAALYIHWVLLGPERTYALAGLPFRRCRTATRHACRRVEINRELKDKCDDIAWALQPKERRVGP